MKTIYSALLIAALASAVSAEPVVNWVAANGDAGFSGGSETTDSPITTDADGETIIGSFPAVTLAIGETLELTGSVNLTGNNGPLPGDQFRWGLFDAPGVPATGVGGGYVGVWASAPAAGTAILVTANGSTGNPFSGSASTTVVTAGDVNGDTPQFGIELAFALTITRLNASQISIAATLGDGGDLLVEWPATTAPASPASFTYDAAAFLLGGALDATTATFTDIKVSEGSPTMDTDTDGDGLPDDVETGTGTFVDAGNTGTDPLKADTDGDHVADGLEVAAGTNPNDPNSNFGARLVGIDFNRSDALSSPSQSRFRIISGSADQGENTDAYTKTIGTTQITVAQPGGTALEFRGGNGSTSRAIPGGDISLSFLVADFVATREGAISITFTDLPAATYVWKSFHLDPFTGSALGFAQGATTTTPNTIEARVAGTLLGSVRPNALGSSGLNGTFIDDSQLPVLAFSFDHDGAAPVTVELSATDSNGAQNFLLLNGFEIFQPSP